MCNFKSFIVTKDGAILHSLNDNGHETIIAENKEKYNLVDDTADKSKLLFARVEILPPGGDVFEQDVSKWSLRIDERITPDWWNKNLKKKCFDELNKLFGTQIFINAENLILKNGIYYFKNSSAVMWEKSSAEMWGNSSAVMWENSSAVMWENSSAVMRENSSAEMREKSSAEMWGNSSAEMRGNSSAVMWENSSAENYSSLATTKISDNGLEIVRYKDNLEIIHAKNTKVKLIKQKESK
jgi:hypothetical protein